MYASYVEAKMEPGLAAQAIEMAKGMLSDVGQILNIKQFALINKVDGSVLLTALYAQGRTITMLFWVSQSAFDYSDSEDQIFGIS